MNYLTNFRLFEKYIKISEIDIDELLKKISKEYGVKIKARGEPWFKRYGENEHTAAFALCGESLIYVRSELLTDPSFLLKTIIHEVGHIYCHRHGIFKNYHIDKYLKDMSPDEVRLFKLTGLRAERFVDKWASIELKKWNPYLKYKFGYYDPETVKFYKSDLKNFSNT